MSKTFHVLFILGLLQLPTTAIRSAASWCLTWPIARASSMCVNGTVKSPSTSCHTTWSTSWLATRVTWSANEEFPETRLSSWRPSWVCAMWKRQPSATAMWSVPSSCWHATSMSWWRWVRFQHVTAGTASKVASRLKSSTRLRKRQRERRAATADLGRSPITSHLCVIQLFLLSSRFHFLYYKSSSLLVPAFFVCPHLKMCGSINKHHAVLVKKMASFFMDRLHVG